MLNDEIKLLIKRSGLFRYEIASAMGISESTLSKWFRKQLSEEQQKLIKQTIKQIKKLY